MTKPSSTMKSNSSAQTFQELCHSFGWKCTPQRMAVYDFLKQNLTHPDVDTVWAAVREVLPSITRESVYRILNEMVDKDLISRVDHVYCARYDSRLGAHGHFICEKCGSITDFDWPEGIPIPQSSTEGTVHHTEIRLIGLCKDCAAKQRQQDGNDH